MEKETTHLLFLHFLNKDLEKRFTKNYDSQNRIFFRIGIYLSCVAWSIWYSGIYFSHQEVFFQALITLVSVLLIPFIIVIAFSYYDAYSNLTHSLAAACNFAAACICIYVAIFLCKDIAFFIAGIICIPFFCYFILRIRFKAALLITFSYAAIGQICIISSGFFTKSQIFGSSSGIWLGFFIATIAGYFFERTNRKIFIQDKLIKEQQEALHLEQEKSYPYGQVHPLIDFPSMRQ